MTDIAEDLCPDCGAAAGQSHIDGCDVARCVACGRQRIGCDHGNSDIGWGHIWTGRWPGEEEVEEGLAADLNDLIIKGVTAQLLWDGQRWQAINSESNPLLSPLQPKSNKFHHIGWALPNGDLVSLNEAWPSQWKEDWRAVWVECGDPCEGFTNG